MFPSRLLGLSTVLALIMLSVTACAPTGIPQQVLATALSAATPIPPTGTALPAATPIPSTATALPAATPHTVTALASASATAPTTSPKPMLTPAVDFADGVSEVPEGHALFVEYLTIVSGEGNCHGRAVDAAWPYFRAADGRLRGYVDGGPSSTGRSRVLVGTKTELGKGAGTGLYSGRFVAVDSLPYALDGISLRSATKQGALVVEINGQSFWITPLQSWSKTEEERTGDCRKTYASTLTNHGLLRDEELDLRYRDGGFDRPYHFGMTKPTPVVVPCETFQPLGEKGWIWDIEIGDDGAIWIAANNGVARFDSQSDTWKAFSPSDGLPTGSVRFVTPDVNGTAWLAFWGEPSYKRNIPVYYFDGRQWGQFAGSQDFQADYVEGVSIAPDQSVWFATRNGVYRWDRATDVWRHYTEADGLHSNSISEILFTPDGKVWFASIGGVSYLDEANLAAGSQAWWSRSDQLQSGGYDAATTSKDGRVWFGGQRYFDTSTQSWVDAVYRGFAYDIAVDSRGGLWVATEGGAIDIPDPDKSPREEWQLFSTANGLGGNSIRSLAIEDEGIVWFGAENATVSRCSFKQ